MDKTTFIVFELQAKAFILDPDHPHRRKYGGGSLYDRSGNGIRVSIDNMNLIALAFFAEGAGEKFYGVNSSGHVERTMKWPESKDE